MGKVNGVMDIKGAAKAWGISQRRVNALCTEGRIPNAQKLGRIWIIPQDTPKPADKRKVTNPRKNLPKSGK